MPETLPMSQGMESTLAQLGSMLLGLVVVLALIVVLLKWMLPGILRAAAPKPLMMDVIDRLPLDPRRGLYVIKVGSQYHLIGMSDMGISHLAQVPPEDVPDIKTLRPAERNWYQTSQAFMDKWRKR